MKKYFYDKLQTVRLVPRLQREFFPVFWGENKNNFFTFYFYPCFITFIQPIKNRTNAQ